MLGNGIKEVRWDLARVPRRNGLLGSAQDITKGNIPERGRTLKSQVIGTARVSLDDLEGERVCPCH